MLSNFGCYQQVGPESHDLLSTMETLKKMTDYTNTQEAKLKLTINKGKETNMHTREGDKKKGWISWRMKIQIQNIKEALGRVGGPRMAIGQA